MTTLPTACPKPAKREKKAPKPIPRQSEKQKAKLAAERATPRKAQSGALMQRRSTPARKTTVKRKNKQRAAEAFAHAYHSQARKTWISGQPCAWCTLRGRTRIPYPSDNAHTGKKPGKGLKSHYTTVVPLCRMHHDDYDDYRAPFDRPSARLTMEAFAPKYADRWVAYSGQTFYDPDAEALARKGE